MERRRRLRDSMKIWALACFAANQLVLADPAPDESRAESLHGAARWVVVLVDVVVPGAVIVPKHGDREPLSRCGAHAGLLMESARAPGHARLLAAVSVKCETLHAPRTDCLPRAPAITCFSGRVVRSRRQRMRRRTGISRRIMLSLPASPQSRSQAASPTKTS